MSFGWIGRPRRIVVTAFTRDRRILRQWDLDLRVGQRVSIPEGTRTVQIDDATTITRTRVRLGKARGLGRQQATGSRTGPRSHER